MTLGRAAREKEKSLNSISKLRANDAAPYPSPTELLQTHRARVALEESERVQQRREELAAQCSDLNPPGVRIRIWEKRHALRLPSSSTHPILDTIAVATRLTLAEVRAEQRARQAPRATVPVA